MKVLLAAMLLSGMLAGCTSNRQTTNNNMEQELDLTQEWDKVFPLSEKVNHQKVTFMTQYGLTLAADLYTPASPDPSKERGEKLPAIAVSGPFGAVKEQCSGLYAMKMAERGFVALAFDPSYTGPIPTPRTSSYSSSPMPLTATSMMAVTRKRQAARRRKETLARARRDNLRT